jgi:hypothetical protein
MTRERRRSASSSEYSGNACSRAPAVWKKFGRDPAARTRTSPVWRSPPAVIAVRVAGSISATSSIRTRTFSSLQNTLRSE